VLVEVAASEFATMRWVMNRLGPTAIILETAVVSHSR